MMNNLIELKKGEIYFLVGFFDNDLTVPTIETYIYEGIDSEGDDSYLFINAVGHLKGQGEEFSNKEGHYISYPQDKINNILDKEHLIQWLRDEHSPKLAGRTHEYKTE